MPPEDLVYLVDDDEAFLSSLKSSLDASGYEVKAFTNARALLDEI